jgi:hypothetical protein
MSSGILPRGPRKHGDVISRLSDKPQNVALSSRAVGSFVGLPFVESRDERLSSASIVIVTRLSVSLLATAFVANVRDLVCEICRLDRVVMRRIDVSSDDF